MAELTKEAAFAALSDEVQALVKLLISNIRRQGQFQTQTILAPAAGASNQAVLALPQDFSRFYLFILNESTHPVFVGFDQPSVVGPPWTGSTLPSQ